MPRAVAGGDFLTSIQELFQEASSRSDQHQHAFAHVRDQLVTLLRMVSETTAAKARARCPVTLPDGGEPETRVQLPPSTFAIQDLVARRLAGSKEPAEFIEVLEEAFEQDRTAAKEDRKRPAKRKSQAQSIPNTPRKKIILKRKTPVAVLRSGVVTPPSRTTKPQEIDESGLQTPVPTPSINMHIKKGDRAIMSPSDFVKRATQTVMPRGQEDIVGRSDEVGEDSDSPKSIISISESRSGEEEEEEVEDAGDEEAFEHESDDAMEVDSPYKRRRRASKRRASQSPERDNDVVVDAAAGLQQIMADVNRTTAEEWESYRPKLLESLEPYAAMEYARLCSLDPVVSGNCLSRLVAAIELLANDIAVIPPENWEKYNRKLHRLCISDIFQSYEFKQRLWKVMDLMYLDEETQAMTTGEWDRLETVAKIVATLCEAMGPEEERAAGLAERWFVSKVQDIRFLKRVTASLGRKNELLESMDGIEQVD